MKKFFPFIIAAIFLSILTSCGSSSPKDVTKDFLTSFQKGDIEKARTYIEDNDETETMLSFDFDEEDGMFEEEVIKALTNGYQFKKIEEIKNDGHSAQVKVTITSVDFGSVMTSAINEIMPMILASAFDENSDETEEAMEELMTNKMIEKLSSKDAPMATREVTLHLEKNKDGEYKMVANEQLAEALIANFATLAELFGE